MPEYAYAEEIPADAGRAWQVLSDLPRWAEWTPSVRSAQLRTAGPLGVGSALRVRQPRIPPATWTVVSWEPGRSFAWESRSPGVLTRAEHTVAPTPGGCRVGLLLRQTGPLAGPVGLLYGGLTRRFLRQELAGLRARLAG